MWRSTSPAFRTWTLKFAVSQPGEWFQLLARKFVLLVSDHEIPDTEDMATYAEASSILAFIGTVFRFGFVLSLSVLGVALTIRSTPAGWPLSFLAAGYAASLVLFYVMGRYRLVLVPLLIPFAAAGISRIAEFKAHPARWKRSVLVGCLVSLVITFTYRPDARHEMAVTAGNFGAEFFDQGLTAQAADWFERAVEYEPQNSDGHYHIGIIHLSRGEGIEAIDRFHYAAQLDPRFDPAYVQGGMTMLALGEVENAVSLLEAAHALAPPGRASAFCYAVAIASMDRNEEAAAVLRTYLGGNADSTIAALLGASEHERALCGVLREIFGQRSRLPAVRGDADTNRQFRWLARVAATSLEN